MRVNRGDDKTDATIIFLADDVIVYAEPFPRDIAGEAAVATASRHMGEWLRDGKLPAPE